MNGRPARDPYRRVPSLRRAAERRRARGRATDAAGHAAYMALRLGGGIRPKGDAASVRFAAYGGPLTDSLKGWRYARRLPGTRAP